MRQALASAVAAVACLVPWLVEVEMVARRHHYLPQCYLKGFSKPRRRGRSNYVSVFDRDGRTFGANIINVATERDFNRIDVEGYPPDAFEQGIAKFEGELGPALVRVLENRSLNNDNDRLLLFNLIGMAAIRNPRYRENIRDFHERTANIVMDLATSTEERWEQQMRQMKATGHFPQHDVPYEELRKFVVEKRFRVEVPTERHIDLELRALDVVLPTLFRRKWAVLLASKQSAGFITCDHPACLMFSDPKMRGGFYGPGHGLAGTDLIFPIGRRMALLGSYEIENRALTLSEEGVASVNGVMVAFAERQIYAADPDFIYARQQNERPRPGTALLRDTQYVIQRK